MSDDLQQKPAAPIDKKEKTARRKAKTKERLESMQTDLHVDSFSTNPRRRG